MTLSKGTRLGPYQVERLLGTGGMGEVYRARDTTLNRDVAIKVLLPAVTADPDRLSRFSREAQVLASLNHPHIAQIYGLEDAGGVPALVLELVDGPTLADRIAHGAIPISEALPIAAQIAEALEAAHEQGIIHRDLKPANIKVREDGTVKVLDFGLAKAFDPSRSTGPDPMNSPTITLHATHVGVILGTAAYMSPEQTKGRAVDRRADLWAFGAVLYEMLTGRRAFGGDEVSEILAHVLMEEPDWNALPAGTPLPIRRLLRRCLEKDRKRRLDSAAAARFEVEDAMTAAGENGNGGADSRAAWRRALPWALTGASAVALALVLLFGGLRSNVASTAPIRVHVGLGAEATLATVDRGSAAILSPNGQALVFVGQRRTGPASLFVRRLDQLDATPLPGTEGAHSPFFSPDGQWIAFFADAKLKKVALSGGAPVTICDTPDGRGGLVGCRRIDRVRAVLCWHGPRRPAARLVERWDADAGHQSCGRRSRTRVAAGLAGRQRAALYGSHQPHELGRCDTRRAAAALRRAQNRPARRLLREISCQRPCRLSARRQDLCCAVRPRAARSDGSPVSRVGRCGLEPEWRLGAVRRI